MIEITLKDYGKIPVLYNDDMQIQRMGLKIGDYYLMREPAEDKVVGDVTTVYEVIRLTDRGHESKFTTVRIT